jgi:hypothetical protein
MNSADVDFGKEKLLNCAIQTWDNNLLVKAMLLAGSARTARLQWLWHLLSQKSIWFAFL